MSNTPSECHYAGIDLGCGDGAILRAVRGHAREDETEISGGIPERLRVRIEWVGWDPKLRARRAAQAELDNTEGLKGCVCDDINAVVKGHAGRASIVTLTNVLHEVRPGQLPGLLVGAAQLLEPGGVLLAYDVERLTDGQAWGDPKRGEHAEWLAIPWGWRDIHNLLECLVKALRGLGDVSVSSWSQTQTTGWTAIVRRDWDDPSDGVLTKARADVGRSVDETLRAMVHSRERKLRELYRSWSGLNPRPGPMGDGVAQNVHGKLLMLYRDLYALWNAGMDIDDRVLPFVPTRRNESGDSHESAEGSNAS